MYRQRSYARMSTQPKLMEARFAGLCVDCRGIITVGEHILYDGKARHADPAVCDGWRALDVEVAAERAAETAVHAPAFAKVIALFDAAAESGLKYPTIRFYFEDGFEVRLQRAGERSQFPGCLQVKDGERNWLGRIQRDGRPERLSDALLARLDVIAVDPVAAARDSGNRSGRCTFCGKLLTVEEKSVALGYGPVCAKKWGLPHNVASGRAAAARRDRAGLPLAS